MFGTLYSIFRDFKPNSNLIHKRIETIMTSEIMYAVDIDFRLDNNIIYYAKKLTKRQVKVNLLL